MRRFSLVLLSCLALVAACGEDSDGPPAADGAGGDSGGSGGTGGTGGTALEVTWRACDEGPGECAVVEVPLDYDRPEGETFPFFVRRLPAASPSKGQLWLLRGGPGYAAWAFAEHPEAYQALAPDYDLYLPDYRGTGFSNWLGCDVDAPPERIDFRCMYTLKDRWGDDLRHFDTTSVARDIGNTIEAIRQPGEKVYIFGVSYGTFLLNRYLTLFPDQADAAVLDSVCPPTGCDVRMSRNVNRVAESVFDMCGADEGCAAKLGADPWERLGLLLARLADGHCSAFLGYPDNRAVIGQIASYAATNPALASVSMAVVYRAERCNAEDVAALNNLYRAVASPGGAFESLEQAAGYSVYLKDHVVFSEFWPDGLDVDAATAEFDSLRATNRTTLDWARLRALWPWPFYESPAEMERWAPTNTPLLLLEGTLDYQTPPSGLAGVESTFREHQQLVVFPLARHGATGTTYVLRSRITCGMAVVRSFFENPEGTPDTSCLAGTPPLDFAGDPALARSVFGTDDLWENPAPTGAVALAPALRPEQERALDELRNALRGPVTF